MKKTLFLCALFLGILHAEDGIIANFGVGAGFNQYSEPSLMHTNELLLNANANLGYRYQFAKLEAVGDGFTTVGQYRGHYRNDPLDGTSKEGTVKMTTMSQTFDGQLKAGVDLFGFSSSYDLFLQSGIGYRYLYHNTAGFKRAQIYVYVPIELEGEIAASPSFAWTYSLGYKHLIEGRHASLIRQIGTDEEDYYAKQDKGFGAKASFGWKETSSDSKTFTRFVVDYWKINQADRKPIVNHLGVIKNPYEPKNFTISVFVQHGWRF
ncbi:MAG: hypothetical protein K2N12_04390 [Helicobacter sp.]|nr:hypothetical protein [Helicobacter sp.]